MSLIKKRIYKASVTAGQNIVIPLTTLPYFGDLGHAYLRKLRFYMDTSLNTGASGATSKMLHDLLASVSIKIGGGFYGLKALSGSQMTAIMSSFGQKPKRFVSANGDTLVGTSVTNQLREIVIDWDFGLIGASPNDFARPCAWYGRGGGELQVSIATVVAANLSSYTSFDLYIWAFCDSKPEKTFCPGILFESRGVDTLSNGNMGRGRLIKCLLQKTTVWTKGEITDLTIFVNGALLLDADIPTINIVDTVPFVTAQNQATFMDTVAAVTAIFVPVYPDNADDKRFTKRPFGDYTFNISGTATAAILNWVYGFVDDYNLAEAQTAFAYMGEPTDVLNARLGTEEEAAKWLSLKTVSKSSTNPALVGRLPLKYEG